MYKKVAGLIISLAIGFVVIPAGAAGLGEGRWVADGVYRSTNYRGLTGLFVTDSAYTIGRHNLSMSTGYLTETLSGATINSVPVSITYGTSDDVEFALQGQYISSSIAGSGSGDTQLAWKWRFRRQTEYMPAMAMAVTAIAPGAPGVSEVTKYGARVNLMASSESQLTDTGYIGLYFDLEADSYDQGTSSQDNFYAGNFGILIPLSDDNRLQAIAEANMVDKRAAPVDNYNAVTAGARYTGDVFQYSLAGQTLNRKDGTTTDRLLFTLTAQF
jgi:hypothetical protein